MSFVIQTTKSAANKRDVVKPLALATTKGAIYVNNVTTGALELAVAGTPTAKVYFLANETQAANANTTVNCDVVSREDIFVADLANNSNAAHNGQRMAIATGALTLTNSGTDAAAGQFEQIAPVGVAADKKALVIRV